MQLLSSDEILDFTAVDDEGRVAKDICPYNSSVYKLITQYELRVFKDLYENSLNAKGNSVNLNEHKNQDVE